MSNLKTLISQIFGYSDNNGKNDIEVLKAAKNIDKSDTPKIKSRKHLSSKIEIMQLMRRRQDIQSWQAALRMAENVHYPDRYKLYEVYNDVMLDIDLSSVIQKRITPVLNADLLVLRDGEPDEDAADLVNTQWMNDLLELAMEAIVYGHSLIELIPKDGMIDCVELIPRQMVSPERSKLYLQHRDERTAIDYTKAPFSYYLLEVGNKTDLGLLAKACYAVIYNRMNVADWSTFNEMFGMPTKEVQYDPNMPRAKEEAEEAAKAAGAAPYIVLPIGSEMKLHTVNQGGNANTYDRMNSILIEKLSKLILGNTMTTSDGSSLSQAQVHLKIEEKMNMRDLRQMEFMLNRQLLPMLIAHGYPLEGCELKFDTTEQLSIEARFAIDKELCNIIEIPAEYFHETYGVPHPTDGARLKPKPNDTDTDAENDQAEPEPQPEKKKSKLNLLYSSDDCCASNLSFEPDKLTDHIAVLSNMVHSGELADGQVYTPLMLEVARLLFAEVNAEWNNDNVDYDTPDNSMLAYMRTNLFAFSSAKNLSQLQEMRNELIDENGKVRSFNDFVEAVAPIHEQYNKNHLQAEYNHTVAASQLASTWLNIEADKELFPFLQYNTVGDDRVRTTHRTLDGKVVAVDDTFWQTYYPPNDWNCRCDVTQLTEDQGADKAVAGDTIDTDDVIRSDYFNKNTGMTGQLFTNDHPYFEGKNVEQLEAVRHYGLPTIDRIYSQKQKLKQARQFASKDKFETWWKRQDGSLKEIDGRLIGISDTFKQSLNDNFGNAIELKSIVSKPSEAYSVGNQSNYIKFYQDRILILSALTTKDKFEAQFLIELSTESGGAIDEYRKGVLLYK